MVIINTCISEYNFERGDFLAELIPNYTQYFLKRENSMPEKVVTPNDHGKLSDTLDSVYTRY